MLTKKQINLIEKESNVTVNDEGNYYSIYVDNPCGEDFTFEIRKTKNKDDVEEIISYCDNFDADEHAVLWYGANRGEPSSLRDLLDNSESIAESLNQMASILR